MPLGGTGSLVGEGEGAKIDREVSIYIHIYIYALTKCGCPGEKYEEEYKTLSPTHLSTNPTPEQPQPHDNVTF